MSANRTSVTGNPKSSQPSFSTAIAPAPNAHPVSTTARQSGAPLIGLHSYDTAGRQERKKQIDKETRIQTRHPHQRELNHKALHEKRIPTVQFEENLYVQKTDKDNKHVKWTHRHVYLTSQYLVMTKIGGKKGKSHIRAKEVIPIDHLTVDYEPNSIDGLGVFPHSYLRLTHHHDGSNKFYGKGHFDQTQMPMKKRGHRDSKGNIVYVMHVGLEDVHTQNFSPEEKHLLAEWNKGAFPVAKAHKGSPAGEAIMKEEALFAGENEKWYIKITELQKTHRSGHPHPASVGGAGTMPAVSAGRRGPANGRPRSRAASASASGGKPASPSASSRVAKPPSPSASSKTAKPPSPSASSKTAKPPSPRASGNVNGTKAPSPRVSVNGANTAPAKK